MFVRIFLEEIGFFFFWYMFQSQVDWLIKLRIHWEITVRSQMGHPLLARDLNPVSVAFSLQFLLSETNTHNIFKETKSECSLSALTVHIYRAIVPPRAKETKIMFMLCCCLKAKLWSFPHVCFGQ